MRALFCPELPPIEGRWPGSTSALPLAKIYATAASFGSFKLVTTMLLLCLDPGRTLMLELGLSFTDELPNVLDLTIVGSSIDAERSRFYK